MGGMTSSQTPAGWALHDGALHTRIATTDFTTGLALVNAIGAAAEEQNHHPDLDLRYDHLDVHLVSHDAGRVTSRDHRLAARIVELTATAGLHCTDPFA